MCASDHVFEVIAHMSFTAPGECNLHLRMHVVCSLVMQRWNAAAVQAPFDRPAATGLKQPLRKLGDRP
jgi:hypothetical protein